MNKWQLTGLVLVAVLAAGSTSGAVLFEDNFDRAAARTLGPNWDETQGDQEWGVDNNTALVTWDRGHRNGRAVAILADAVDASAGFELNAKTEAVNRNQNDSFAGLLFAYQDTQNYWEFETRNHGVANTLLWQVEVWEVVGGVRTQRGPTVEPEIHGWNDLSVNYDGANLTVTGGPVSIGPLAVSLPDGGVGLFSRAVDAQWFWDDFHLEGTLVPEPATVIFVALGGLCALRRRR